MQLASPLSRPSSPPRFAARFAYFAAVGIGLCWSTGVAAKLDLTPRPILATADTLRPLGRIGAASAAALGIDARGRVLLYADLSDGTFGLFRAAGSRLETLWRSGSEEGPLVYPSYAITSPGGRVVSLGRAVASAGLPGETDTLYQLSPPPLRALVQLGDHTAEGEIITYLYEPAAVADDGTVAVLASVKKPGESEPLTRQAALLVSGEGVFLVAGEGPEVPSERRFDSLFVFGLTADGGVLFSAVRYSPELLAGIYAAGRDEIRPIVVDGALAPSGVALRQVRPLGAAPNGEVLFAACEDRPVPGEDDDEENDLARFALCHVFRTEGDRFAMVASGADLTPDGSRFLVDRGSLSDNGEAVLQASWLDERLPEPQNDPLFSGVLFYPVDGEPVLVAAPARGVESAGDGDVVYEPLTGEQSTGVYRWRAGRSTRVVDADTRLADGARFIAGGLVGSRCLAADGRVASFAGFADGGEALVCVDGDGPSPVARLEQLAAGSNLDSRQCAFAGEGEVVFSAHGGVFRATDAGVEMVVGAGVVTDRGTTISGLDPYSSPFRDQTFAVNRSGTVVVLARSDSGTVLVRQRRGGRREEIALDLAGGEETVDVLLQAEVAEDDSVLALVRFRSDPPFPDNEATAIVLYDDAGGRILFRAATLGGAPGSIWARGTLVAFAVDRNARHYVYDTRTGALDTMLERDRYPALASDPFLLDFADNGDAVFFAYARVDGAGRNGWWVLDDDTIHLVASDESGNQPTTDPLAVNAAGNVLFEALSSPSGANVQLLSLSGPAPNGRCPEPLVDSSDGGDGGCRVDNRGGVTWWQPWLLGLALIAGRFSRAHCRAKLARYSGQRRNR